MSGPALVLSMVETETRTAHLVGIDVVPLRRRSGVYPALCGAEVRSASLATSATGRCAKCRELAATPQPTVPARRFRVPFQPHRGDRR